MAWQEESHWWFKARRIIVARIITRLGLSRQASILDMGCGTGGNLAMLSGFGKVEAVEVEDWAREIASAKMCAAVVPGWLPDGLPFHEPLFDLIVLLDVLEHVSDDEAALDALGRLLKPGGSLLITVPAFPFLWSPHDEVHHHFRRYRLGELEGKLTQAGMEISYASYFNILLFPIIASVRLLGRFRSGLRVGDLAMPHSWVNQMLYAIFSSERFLLGRFRLPFGVSAMVLAKRGA
jgi:SAM-dependent methyltransferase